MSEHKSVPENPPAFPIHPDSQGYDFFTGMTMRDWFAGRFASAAVGGHVTAQTELNPKAIAKDSYEFADAMLAARKASK